MKHVKDSLLFFVMTILIVASVFSSRASAHVLQSDHGVTAILHIKPDDNPIAGKSVPVNFLFSNNIGGFSLNNYKVQLRLLQNDTLKFSSAVPPLFFGSATEGETMATFPDAGVYKLLAVGTPLNQNVPPFTLSFTVRVADDPAALKKQNGSTTAILSGFGVVALGMLAAKGIKSGGKYRRPTK